MDYGGTRTNDATGFCASASDAGRIGRHVWSIRTSIYTSVTRMLPRCLRATTELAIGRVAPDAIVITQAPRQSNEEHQHAVLDATVNNILQPIGDIRLI